MDLRQLTIFIEVARRESFTRAAERLRIAQPAVSISVKKLEDELDLVLLNRQGRKVSLTAEGELLLAHGEGILSRVKAAKRALGEMRELERGEVRVGIPTMLGSYYFPEIIIEFMRRYPKLRFSVNEYGTRRVQELLSRGELDMGVIVTDNVPEELEFRPFLKEEMVACVPPGHPFALQSSVSYEEFAAEPLVLFKEGYFQREVVARASLHAGVTPKVAFETNLIPLIKSLVLKGFGITTFLEMVLGDTPELSAVRFDPPLSFELGIAWKKNALLSRANRAFVDFLLAEGEKLEGEKLRKRGDDGKI